MMPFISFLGPVLLTAMGSISLAVCYQAIMHMVLPKRERKEARQTFRYVVPKLKEIAPLDSVKVHEAASGDWPRFSTGGCAISSDGNCSTNRSTSGFEDARESTPDPMDTMEVPIPPSTKTRPPIFCPLRV